MSGAIHTSLDTLLNAFLQTASVAVIGNDRAEFRAAELGLSFDGKMIYDRDKLAEVFATRDGMELEDAYEWIDFNISGVGAVHIADVS